MKVNIIGHAPGWEAAPFDEECWGFNDILLKRPVDLILDMHDIPRYLSGDFNEKQRPTLSGYKKGLALADELRIPVYSLENWEEITTCKKYPLSEIVACFGNDYFGSGVDYAVALAIFKGYTKIDLYGVAMLMPNEYAHQKPSLEFWIGYGIGKGIEIGVKGHSTVMKLKSGKLYGYNIKQGELLK